MVNFCENVLGGSGYADLNQLLNDDGVPTWIDEGFAMASEQIWAADIKNITDATTWPVYDRITWYNSSSNYTEGSPLIRWVSDESGLNVLDNYSNSFLFFQYLRTQATSIDKTDIFYDMVGGDYSTNNGTNLIQSVSNSNGVLGSFDDILRNWIIANKINSTTGNYGYLGADGLKDVNAWSGADEITSWNFYPGAYIYRKMGSSGTFDADDFDSSLKAYGFDSSGNSQDCSSGGGCPIDIGEYLVIFNNNTNPDGSAIANYVPTGVMEESAKAAFKAYDDSKPHRIDWNIRKPYSDYFGKGTKPFKLPEFDGDK
jgi:hypothetical protein